MWAEHEVEHVWAQEYARARLEAEYEAPSPRRDQPVEQAPAPQKVVVITGGIIDFEFHGVPPNDAYVKGGIDVLKHKRGPKVNEEFSFFDGVPLHRIVGVGFDEAPTGDFKTLKDLIEHGVRLRLGFSVSDLVVPYVKVTVCEPGMLAAVAPFEMLALDTPVQIVYEAGKSANVMATRGYTACMCAPTA